MTKLSIQINKKKIRILLFFGSLSIFSLFGFTTVGSEQTRENNVVKAVRKVSPAVVNISSEYEIRKNSNPFSIYGMDPMFENFFRDFFSPEYNRREKRTSLGSGVIIDGDRGFVLTNAHVIEKATSIHVTLNDERELSATIVGMDPDSDLAVLKIESEHPLPSVQMGDSDDIMIGESVIAIGNPFGFSHTVTTGVVSAVNRSIKTNNHIFHEFIQTDASINPGNSGGPLLNIDGQLIGINTAIYAEAQGIGFAIPINRARRIVSDLINFGQVVQAWIGLAVQSIDTSLSAYLNIDRGVGVIVSQVELESPAASEGFLEGDIIISVDGEKITGLESYIAKIKDVSVGQIIQIAMIRQGKSKTLSLTATKFPVEQALNLAKRRMGIEISPLDEKIRSEYGIRATKGVLISKMQRNSHLYRIGVRPGDIVRQIDEARIDDMEDFKTAIVRYRNKTSVVMLILRDGQFYYVNANMKDGG